MVRTGPVAGLIGQLALLVVVTAAVGLGPVGWCVGIGVGATTSALLARGLGRAGAVTLGPANTVTLVRATLAGGVAALVADAAAGSLPVAGVVWLSSVALALDAVDGRVARRTSTESALGARFDMEVDAFLILVLSLAVAGSFGAWVLAIGFARYALWLAERVLPWLRHRVPPRYWRKVVAAVQGVVLVVAVSAVLPAPVVAAALVLAAVLLAESFGRDVFWLRRHYGRPAAVRAGSQVAAPVDRAPASRVG